MLYGAAKGTAASIAGLPGDIEQLARQLLLSGAAPDSYTAKNMAAQALLPTSDRVRAMLPSLPGAGPQAQYSENMGATLGQNVVGNLVAPMVAPAARMAGEGAMATGRFVAPKAGQLAEQYMVRTGGILPLDVYHGTPHTLPPTPNNPLGEFDASKIGTGEGAQAYGHGIYTAENPNVAKGYANRLGANVVTVDGKPMDFNNPIHIAASIISDPNNAGLPGKQLASAIRYDPKGIVPFGAESKVEEIAKALESGNLPKFTNQKGNLYKVDLPDEKIAKMLDWDKPLSQQPNILKVLEKNYRSDYLDMFKNLPGSDFYKAISGNEGIEDLRALGSSELTNLGIPGIKYLDEMSRSAGKGTRNFVVFPGEEKSMTILERNGQPAQMSVAEQIDNINEVLKKKRKK
jgi:hypothetical protein